MEMREWLRAVAKAWDDREGDFIKDARADLSFPAEIGDWAALRCHLIHRSACPEAIEAGHKVWNRYNKYRQKNGPAFLPANSTSAYDDEARSAASAGRRTIQCRHCLVPMTWADQRRQYGRLIKRGVEPREVKELLPRCQKFVTERLRREEY